MERMFKTKVMQIPTSSMVPFTAVLRAIVTEKLGLQPALGKPTRGQVTWLISKAMVHSRSP